MCFSLTPQGNSLRTHKLWVLDSSHGSSYNENIQALFRAAEAVPGAQ